MLETRAGERNSMTDSCVKLVLEQFSIYCDLETWRRERAAEIEGDEAEACVFWQERHGHKLGKLLAPQEVFRIEPSSSTDTSPLNGDAISPASTCLLNLDTVP